MVQDQVYSPKTHSDVIVRYHLIQRDEVERHLFTITANIVFACSKNMTLTSIDYSSIIPLFLYLRRLDYLWIWRNIQYLLDVNTRISDSFKFI